MAQVILFGGGDGGGLIISKDGVVPIPPFDPALRLQLRCISALLRSESGLADSNTSRQLMGIVNRLSNLVIGEIEKEGITIDADVGVIYTDEDGGFTCGSSGKPPTPLPWPMKPIPTGKELMRAGFVDKKTLSFLNEAVRRKADLRALFDNPRTEAARIGLAIPADVARKLKTFRLAQNEASLDAPAREALSFLNAVVVDGRFLTKVATHPAEVAKNLNFTISEPALQLIHDRLGGGPVEGDDEAVIALCIVLVIVVIAVREDRTLPVIDRSGVAKF